MELRTFIKQALTDIIHGVSDAQQDVRGLWPEAWGPEIAARRHGAPGAPENLEDVAFDLAVTVSSGTKTAGGIQIALAAVVLGSKGQSTADSEQVSRLSFKVPLRLPQALRIADQDHPAGPE